MAHHKLKFAEECTSSNDIDIQRSVTAVFWEFQARSFKGYLNEHRIVFNWGWSCVPFMFSGQPCVTKEKVKSWVKNRADIYSILREDIQILWSQNCVQTKKWKCKKWREKNIVWDQLADMWQNGFCYNQKTALLILQQYIVQQYLLI